MAPVPLLAVRYLSVSKFVPRSDRIEIFAESRQLKPPCPLCGTPAHRVQSRYERKIDDLPWIGVAVRLILCVRRYFCDEKSCPRRIFAERISEIAARYARKTARLCEVINQTGCELGGRPGVRIMTGFGIKVNRNTLLRAVRRAPIEESQSPRILGVDDWSMRRGQTYGTILIDLEQHRRVDLLPDRKADTLAAWLAERPGIEIVSRDRAPAYADGVAKGAPTAIQIADRWHLLKNAGDALEGVIGSQRKALEQVARELNNGLREAARTDSVGGPVITRAKQGKAERRTRRLARYDCVVELFRAGWSKRSIAREVGLDVRTVRKFLATDSFPERAERHYWSSLDPHVDFLRDRWAEGCRNATTLWREVRERGYSGSSVNVRRLVAPWRENDGRRQRTKIAPSGRRPPKCVTTPSPRRAKWLLLRDVADLDIEERQMREQLLAASQTILCASGLIQDFGLMIRNREAERLDAWIAAARASGINAIVSFAAGLESDRAAVEASMKYEWSNGQVEEQVNRLKAIKRSMYGRAKFDLLRRRVLGVR